MNSILIIRNEWMKYQQALQKAPVCTKISTNAYTV